MELVREFPGEGIAGNRNGVLEKSLGSAWTTKVTAENILSTAVVRGKVVLFATVVCCELGKRHQTRNSQKKYANLPDDHLR